MSAIWGMVQRDGTAVDPGALAAMGAATAHWGADGGGVWLDGCAGLGQGLLIRTPEARTERLPWFDVTHNFAFTAAARVDNRAELLAACRAPPAEMAGGAPGCAISDGDLILCAYQRWGAACVERIYGDWAFAVWHPAERKLFLARDHFGNTALYYFACAHVFAFASERQALLDLKLAPITLDELYLAQVLISWPAYQGERTIHTPIKRLPPAHALTVTPDHLAVRQYWFLERTPELHLPRREQYAEAFRAIFDEAVRARLRTARGDDTVGVSLSGGLDSGSITVTAAGMLATEGRRLVAFTAVPIADTRPYVGGYCGDEWPLARATAQFAHNVDLQPIPAAHITPIQAIRRVLQIHHEPGHAAGNYFWLLAVEETAHAQGCGVLLTGQFGDDGVSWKGSVFSQSLARQVRSLGWRTWAKARVKRSLPPELLAAMQRVRHERSDWVRATALRPAFAARLDLTGRYLDDLADRRARSSLEGRIWLNPGRSMVGALHAQMGAAHGLEIRDPTADARLLAFAFAVPDRIFMDPATGCDRWLMRTAMQGRLPDAVRLNRQRGRQAGDLVPRLRATAAEVETALHEIERGPAAAYVDVPNMRDAWRLIQTQETPEAFRKAGSVLTRGIMAGLFVNDLFTTQLR